MATITNSKLRICSSDMELGKRHRQTWTNFNGETGETVKGFVMKLIRHGRKMENFLALLYIL
jgi:hypothetical protein